MSRLAIVIAMALAACGCAGPEYYDAIREQTAAWERVQIARHQTEAQKYVALATVAERGNDYARLAVALTMNGGAQAIAAGSLPPMPVIRDPAEDAMRWVSLILPTATSLAGGYFQYRAGVAASNAQARTAEASYAAIGSLGSAGFGAVRDVALGGFSTFASLPPSSVTNTTTTVNVSGNDNQTALDGGSVTRDQSRRCAPVFPTGTMFAGPFTGGAGANSFTASYPFAC